MNAMPRYSFERFCLDSDRKVLSRAEEPIHLTPRAFRLLEYLLQRSPKAVSKRELLDHVWAGGIVEESNLKTLVLEIRTALKHRGGQAGTIRTAFGFGYAIGGSVHVEDDDVPTIPLVTLRWQDGVVRLPAGTHTIGRAAGCAVVLESPSVSREHARLTVTRYEMRLQDLGSKNGTFFGNVRIETPVALFDVCRISFGEVIVEVSRLGKENSTETAG